MNNKYYNEYIDLCLKINNKEDYSDKEKVKRHNQAMKKLFSLQQKMNSNIQLCSEVLNELMKNDNDKVKLMSSSHCLQQKTNIEKAKKTLKQLAKKSSDSVISGEAKIVLELYM